eukprot:CAMPEP_0196994490 /NCGR_PEP_ID=MMETSP1380-20130617/775_1 /TAXON_ID=5936 /ORGANISM="Euplotes crassus, Strain CT5" /LENGTH=193 /DNA_ID=CAMNT_0042409879 /DNA_START=86 /DNA_END=667 /DNA_ORIENTATION=-
MSHFEILKIVMEEVKVEGRNFDEVWMVPCGDRRDKKVSTPGEKRQKMCELGIKEMFGDDERYKVQDIEVKNRRSIPTYYLMLAFEEMYPECEFYFVLGSDLLPSFKRWDRGEVMFEEFKFIIIPREGYEDLDSDLYPRYSEVCKSKVDDPFATSSTEVRSIIQWSNIISHKAHLKEKMGSAVYDYIIENNLFA